MKYKLTIAYVGTDYVGWQVQPEGESIQGLIEKALSKLFRTEIRVIGASRTDSGVHALGQTAHFRGNTDLTVEELHFRLNLILPKSIRILKIEEVDESFHAQMSASSKIYHYHIWLDPVEDPFLLPFRARIFRPLDLEKMERASSLFLGTHDFSAFANAGSSAKSFIRTLFRVDIVKQAGGIRIEFEGNSFLYKMVRNIVGMLLEIGYGRREPDDINKIFSSKDRKLAPPPAPPQGLFLMRVDYK